jgi:hypothetical protein
MANSHYDHYEAEAKARQASVCTSHPNGTVRQDSLGNFEMRLNLQYGPLRLTYSRGDALKIADAIYALDRLTAPQRPEE